MTVVIVLRLIMALVAKRSAKRQAKEKSIELKPVENDEVFDHLFIDRPQTLIKL